MLDYRLDWNLATIPDEILAKEFNRRRVVRQNGRNPGADKQRKVEPCPICGEGMGARALREHLPACKRAHPVEALKYKQRQKEQQSTAPITQKHRRPT